MSTYRPATSPSSGLSCPTPAPTTRNQRTTAARVQRPYAATGGRQSSRSGGYFAPSPFSLQRRPGDDPVGGHEPSVASSREGCSAPVPSLALPFAAGPD